MKQISMLDCTLREAPLEGMMWGNLPIRKIIDGLECAGIEMIEVGFLKNDSHREGSTSFQRVEEIAPYLHKKSGVLYTALVDYGRYDLNHLSDYDGTSVDVIRICFKHSEIDLVLDYAAAIQKKGYKICIQHVDTMGFHDKEIIDFIKKVNDLKPFAYSIVDTFGAMYGTDVRHYMELVDSELDEDIEIGFHAHNNLMLANANVQLFIETMQNRRNVIVDTSLYGCGRSAGNAHTELIAQYMNQRQGTAYEIDEVLDLIDTAIVAAQEQTSWGYCIPYFISGVHNAHTFNAKQLLKRHNLKSKDLRAIIERLNDVQKKVYDYALLEELYVEYFDRSIDDAVVIQYLTTAWAQKKILILAPGRSVQMQKAEIDEFVAIESPIVIGCNDLIDGYVLNYIFYSSALRYQNLQYQDYKAAGSPRIILSSNVKTSTETDEFVVNYGSLIKFGWVNLDSSIILLLRLLQRCGINELYVAGLDGYGQTREAFYKKELDTGLDEKTRQEITSDNLSMLEDMKASNPAFSLHFLTESVYREVFE